MERLYLYSLAPVVSVATLLFFSAALYGRNARGLAAYCFAVAAWSGTLAFAFFPPTAALGQRLVASGGYVAAAYLHAAYDFTHQKDYKLVWLAYGVATGIMLVHLFYPGLLYDPVALTAGPIFWPTMGLAVVAATIPLWQLYQAYGAAAVDRRPQLIGLFAAGALAYLGAWSNALLLSYGVVLPVGMFIVLASLFVLANVVRRQQEPGARRLLDRSLAYSTLAAFLSAGFLFGVLSLTEGGALFTSEYGLSAFFLMVLAAVAFEPLRQQIQEFLGRHLFKDSAHTSELMRALVDTERRASQAERLAELGTFTSAVAHEVRNPLGVLSAHLKLLERTEVDPETVATMREQIRRAERFVDDLLRYGRPARLELRLVDVGATVDLAWSTAKSALGEAAAMVPLVKHGLDDELVVEADTAQLLQVLVILFDNALLALEGRPNGRVEVTGRSVDDTLELTVEDTGPGIPDEVHDRLFEPFVTSRGRSAARSGTGLGLAIARGIVERHGGTISAARSRLSGALFRLRIPRTQRLLAAAQSHG